MRPKGNDVRETNEPINKVFLIIQDERSKMLTATSANVQITECFFWKRANG